MKGFTLIELLVVIVVVVGIGAIVSAILFSSFRGATKTNTITVVRQNGNYAISQMAKTIRGAKRLNGMSTDGTTFTTSCQESLSYPYLRVTELVGSQVTFSCPGSFSCSNQSSIQAGNSSLIDTTAVCITSCSFTCSRPSPSDFPTIGIRFSLTQKSPSILVERTAPPIQFQTSVTMRNVPR